MTSMAKTRIAEERKAWRKNKPFGFHARPETGADGSASCSTHTAAVCFSEKGSYSPSCCAVPST